METKHEVYSWDKDNNFNVTTEYDVHAYPSPDNSPVFNVFGARALYEFQERERRKKKEYTSYYYAIQQEKIINKMINNNQSFHDIRNIIYESMVTLFFNHLQISITNPEYIDLSLYGCYYFYIKCFNQNYEHDGNQLIKIYNNHLKEMINSEIFSLNNTFISFDFLNFLNELELL